jgi:hypothetical protein
MIETLDRPPPGFRQVGEVMRTGSRKSDWVALMTDAEPSSQQPGHDCWVRIPGKHRSYEAARNAFEVMIATKH